MFGSIGLFVCLSVWQHYSKDYEQIAIFMEGSEGVKGAE